MTSTTTPSSLALVPSLERAWQDVDSSFERFCLTAGIGAIERMLCEDASMAAMLRFIARGYVASTAMNFRYRLGRRHRPWTGLAAGR